MADKGALRVVGDTVPHATVALSTVTVRDLMLAADIGAYDHEIGREQKLVLTVVLHVDPVENDRLDEAVDYTCIVALARALASERIALIETFALRLAEACLNHATVNEADVLVEKPGALANGVAGARVVLRRN